MPSVCALQKIRKLEAIGYQDIGIKHKFGSWKKGGKRFWNIETFTDAVVLAVQLMVVQSASVRFLFCPSPLPRVTVLSLTRGPAENRPTNITHRKAQAPLCSLSQ